MHPVLKIPIKNYPTPQVLMSASCVRRSCLANYPERSYFPLLIPKEVPLLSSFPQPPHRGCTHPWAPPRFGNAPGGALCSPGLGYSRISPLGLWCPPGVCPVHSRCQIRSKTSRWVRKNEGTRRKGQRVSNQSYLCISYQVQRLGWEGQHTTSEGEEGTPINVGPKSRKFRDFDSITCQHNNFMVLNFLSFHTEDSKT